MEEYLNFEEYILEKSISDSGTDGDDNKYDEKAEKDSAKYLAKENEKCPRCGKPIAKCTCQEDDSADTINVHRFKTKKQ